jgi:hypothetical protein
MLVQVHNKLKNTSCPSCNETGSLEALLVCSREDQTCRTACQCSKCATHFVINLPAELKNIESKTISCDIVSRECSFFDKNKKAA